MADHLKVDVDHIRSSAGQIAEVRHRFDSADSTIDHYSDSIGSSVLTDKLHEFATNWKYHREDISKSLDTFSGWASKAADAYDGTEDSLVRALKGRPA